jgi:NhaP-type Na+/H+ or K+/H+ antiporter
VVTDPMSASQILVGIVLTLGLAVACQIIAAKIRSPAIVLLLPVGFVAGALTTVINPDKIFGAAFPPLVSLAVAVVLFDGGLDLVTKELQGESRRVVHRLRDLGIPMTWAGAAFFGWLLLGLSWKTAVMLGAILIVSGPTVVTLCVPKTSSMSCDQVIFVGQAADAGLSSDAVPHEVGGFG